MMCIIYGTVVTQFKGEIDTVTRSVCVIATFTQVPTETGAWWSLNDPDGILKQRNSKSLFTYYMTMAPLLSETHYIGLNCIVCCCVANSNTSSAIRGALTCAATVARWDIYSHNQQKWTTREKCTHKYSKEKDHEQVQKCHSTSTAQQSVVYTFQGHSLNLVVSCLLYEWATSRRLYMRDHRFCA